MSMTGTGEASMGTAATKVREAHLIEVDILAEYALEQALCPLGVLS